MKCKTNSRMNKELRRETLGSWAKENIKMTTFSSVCSQILLPLLLAVVSSVQISHCHVWPHCMGRKQWDKERGLSVFYLRSQAGVWSSLPPLWPPWAAGTTTATENPDRENAQPQFTPTTVFTHHSQQPSAKCTVFKNERVLFQLSQLFYVFGFLGRKKKDEEEDEVREGGKALFVCSEQKQSHSRDRGTLADPYRGDRLEVSYGGRCCRGCGCGACCIGHPGREVNGPAVKALRSHLQRDQSMGGLSGPLTEPGVGSDVHLSCCCPWPGITSMTALCLSNQCGAPTAPRAQRAPWCGNRPLMTFGPPAAAASHSAVPV